MDNRFSISGRIAYATLGLFAGFAVSVPTVLAQNTQGMVGEPVLKLHEDKIEWELTNLGEDTHTVSGITLSWPAEHAELESIKLGGDKIFDQSVPPPGVTINSDWTNDADDRRIKSGDSKPLKFEFNGKYHDASLVDYKITVDFESGQQVHFDVDNITDCTVAGGPILKVKDKKIEWKLYNLGTADVVIASINLEWPNQNGDLQKIQLKGNFFNERRSPPETFIDGGWSNSDPKKRRIKAGENEKLEFEFQDKFSQANALDYGIQVVFESGCMVHFNAPFDEENPLVTLFDPADGNVDDALLDIVFELIDEPAGIDTSTIVVTANGVVLDPDRYDFDGRFLIVTADPAAPWAPGNLLFYIDVADNAGNGDRYTFNLRVLQDTGAFPVAIPTSGFAPLAVTFIPQSTADTAIALYEWDFENDGIFDRSDVIGINQRFTYTTPGTYNATLRVTDQAGAQDVSFVVVQVNNRPPQVVAEAAPSNGPVPLLVNFVATATDNEGIALYEWDFDGDGSFDTSSDSDNTASFTYSQQGIFQPQVRVTDTLGAVTTLVVPTIEVRVNPPGSPTVTASATPVSGAVPLTVNFSATATDPDGLAISEWAWDFDNDGVFEVQGVSPNVSYTYDTAGTYFARVRVTATDGGVSEDLIQINVEPAVTLSVSIDTIDPGLMETSVVNTVLGGSTSITIVIEDRDGAVVRTLVPSGNRAAGSYDDPWDGTDDNGDIVQEGDYYAVALFEVDGETQRLDLRTTTGGSQYLPGRTTLPSSFSPLAGNPLTFTFVLPTASEVTSFMGRFNVDVRLITFFQRVPFGRGSHTVVWNGENADGQLIHPPPGDRFLLGLFGYRLANNAIFVRSGAQVSGLMATPSIFSPGSVGMDGNPQMSELSFTLSNDASSLELTVFDADSGAELATLSYPALTAGAQTLQWDGRTTDGVLVAPGRYRLGLTAINANGFRSMTTYVLQRIYH